MSVTFERLGRLGIAWLDREAALNTLNLEMVTLLLKQIQTWQHDSSVTGIVIRGRGAKSFCSGGDVKTVVLEARQSNPSYGDRFFEEEYKLDYAIHTSSKPIMVIAHGYTMGGGIGLLAGATHRVVTETSVLAMPEITIGLFPDVGGSFFLNRMPEHVGAFLALTATRFNGSDALDIGLANLFVPTQEIDELLKKFECAENLELWSKQFKSQRPATQLKPVFYRIAQIMSASTPERICAQIESLATDSDPLFSRAAQTLSKGSPTSAFLILEQLNRGKSLSLEECFAQELHMAKACCRGHDFIEGVRALLIDKDQKPNWHPKKRSQVTCEMVLKHF